MKPKGATGSEKNKLLFETVFQIVIFSLATSFVHTESITGPEKISLLKGRASTFVISK